MSLFRSGWGGVFALTISLCIAVSDVEAADCGSPPKGIGSDWWADYSKWCSGCGGTANINTMSCDVSSSPSSSSSSSTTSSSPTSSTPSYDREAEQRRREEMLRRQREAESIRGSAKDRAKSRMGYGDITAPPTALGSSNPRIKSLNKPIIPPKLTNIVKHCKRRLKERRGLIDRLKIFKSQLPGRYQRMDELKKLLNDEHDVYKKLTWEAIEGVVGASGAMLGSKLKTLRDADKITAKNAHNIGAMHALLSSTVAAKRHGEGGDIETDSIINIANDLLGVIGAAVLPGESAEALSDMVGLVADMAKYSNHIKDPDYFNDIGRSVDDALSVAGVVVKPVAVAKGVVNVSMLGMYKLKAGDNLKALEDTKRQVDAAYAMAKGRVDMLGKQINEYESDYQRCKNLGLAGDQPVDWDGALGDKASSGLPTIDPSVLKGPKRKPASDRASIDKIHVPSPIQPWEKFLHSSGELDLSIRPGFSFPAAKAAGAFSSHAYDSEEKAAEWLSANGFKPVLTKKDASGKEEKVFVGEKDSGTEFIVASRPNEDGNEYVISVRGTESQNDWEINANLLKNEVGDMEEIFKGKFGKPVPGLKGGVHAGYYAAALEIANDLPPEVVKNITSNNKSNLTITGHSMGGGVATILTAMLSEMGVKSNMQTYTFAAPAVGDKSFTKSYSKLNVHRITAKKDAVPGATTAARNLLSLAPGGGMRLAKDIMQGGFGHIGSERRINTPDDVKSPSDAHSMNDNYFKNMYIKNFDIIKK